MCINLKPSPRSIVWLCTHINIGNKSMSAMWWVGHPGGSLMVTFPTSSRRRETFTWKYITEKRNVTLASNVHFVTSVFFSNSGNAKFIPKVKIHVNYAISVVYYMLLYYFIFC